MSGTAAVANSTQLERDARRVTAHEQKASPTDIAIGVVIGRISEYFAFFVYAIASVLVFPQLLFSGVPPLTGTLYSFALFALAFVARPVGSVIFLGIDSRYGRVVKLTIALFLLGGSTMAMSFLPSYKEAGYLGAGLLAVMRLAQGAALGGSWDGLPALLSLAAPEKQRGWYAMVPQLGAPIGLLVASGLFAFFRGTLSAADFLDWGWRYAFFVAFALNVVALFARLRLVATPAFEKLFETRELQPSPVGATIAAEWRVILLGAFVPLAGFALFHLVTVFPLSWIVLFTHETPTRFLLIEMLGAGVGLLAMLVGGLISDRIGRQRLLAITAVAIGVFSAAAPALDQGGRGELIYMIVGFVLLGLAFGQSSGATGSSFAIGRRYTGSALTTDLAWLIGAGFAPLAALVLATRFGLVSTGVYLLSGAVCTLAALWFSRAPVGDNRAGDGAGAL